MSNLCLDLHKLFNSMPRYNLNTIDDIPFKNGIYIFFEKGEKYGDFDRIVRVGTDTGQNNLLSRLKQHLLNENKDRSIFRKNIGRAMLNKQGNLSLLKYWNYDLTTRANKAKYFDNAKDIQCKVLEKKISSYMQNNFSFTVFPVETKEDRLRFEEAIISALYNSDDFKTSKDWLGNFVQKTRENHVQDSRMWLSLGINAKELTDSEFDRLCEICRKEKVSENCSNQLYKKEDGLSL